MATKPLENCSMCNGSGTYLDRYEEAWGRSIPVYEPCPCLDREEEETLNEIDELVESINRHTETIKRIDEKWKSKNMRLQRQLQTL